MRTFTRRKYIKFAIGGTVFLAGCSESDDLSEIKLNNNADEDWDVEVEATNEDGQDLFKETIELEANMRNETIEPFSGEPAEISVTINNNDPITADWPENAVEIRDGSSPEFDHDGCDSISGESITGVYIHIVGEDHIFLEPTCNTPRRS